MHRRAVCLLGLCVVGALPSWAQADLILQPASASTNMGTLSGSPNGARDQSGLSVTYTSLLTDFDAYLAGNPTHNSGNDDNCWVGNTATGNFDFDLGGSRVLLSFALWNYNAGGADDLVGFNLLADDNAAFSSPVTLGSFVADANFFGSSIAIPAQVFTFTATSASFVRLQITSNVNSPFTAFGEGAFEVQAIPEASSLATVGLVLVGNVAWFWRLARVRNRRAR